MYAIIEDGGRQHKVEEGQQVEIDYREVAAGEEVTFDRVLAVRDDDGLKVGHPTLDAAVVTGEVVSVARGPKLVIQKFSRRKASRTKTGHRQIFTSVKINKIAAG